MAGINLQKLDAYQRALKDLNRQANYDILQLYRVLLAESADPGFVRDMLVEVMPALTERYGEAAGRLAVDWYVSLDMADGFDPIVAPLPAEQKAKATAAWAAHALEEGNPDEMLKRMNILVQSHLYKPSRDTVILNAERQGVPWARVTRAGGCAFCRMLASRGFVYESPETAGSPDSGNKYHDHCRCVVIPKRRSVTDEDVPNLSLFRKQYYEAREDLTDTTGENRQLILNRMRKLTA